MKQNVFLSKTSLTFKLFRKNVNCYLATIKVIGMEMIIHLSPSTLLPSLWNSDPGRSMLRELDTEKDSIMNDEQPLRQKTTVNLTDLSCPRYIYRCRWSSPPPSCSRKKSLGFIINEIPFGRTSYSPVAIFAITLGGDGRVLKRSVAFRNLVVCRNCQLKWCWRLP